MPISIACLGAILCFVPTNAHTHTRKRQEYHIDIFHKISTFVLYIAIEYAIMMTLAVAKQPESISV